ncbi:MAG: long-chain fatty acid--CoA ligase [Deltaproteobacteria bacterium]|nr:long-chain fatty acid--CoA ligase [Deltaproteobacteria bacterium]
MMRQAMVRPCAPAYREKLGGVWRTCSWQEYVGQIRTTARALIALGVRATSAGDAGGGQASCVCILGANRPEWAIFDFAAMAVGAAPAGIYATSSPSEVAYLLGHTEAPVVLVDGPEQWQKIRAGRERLPGLRHVVLMRGAAPPEDEMVMTWEQFLARAASVEEAALRQRIDALRPDALATLIYTPGTTGPPKGAMLSHQNLAWTARTAVDLVDATSSDCTLSYLPLSHVAEQMFSLHGPATAGSQICFAESVEKVADNLKEVQPPLVFGVPSFWEKFHALLAARLAQASGLRARLIERARRVGALVARRRNRGIELPLWLAAEHALADRLVYSKVKAAMGLGRAKLCISGAAPIAPEILEFFAGFDLTIHEIYGQSEDCGPTSFNLPGQTRFGSVGLPLPGLQLRFLDDGEIQCRAPNVFMGYYKDPEETAAVLTQGWLSTGDLGRLDADGFLYITGRKKELLITAGGKNVAPCNIEAALEELSLIGTAVVIGDRRRYLTALVALHPKRAAAFAAQHGLDAAALDESDAVRAEIKRHVERVNERLARAEQIKAFAILPRPLSLEEGELTPTLKVRRNVVSEHFAAQIDAMYAGQQVSAADGGARRTSGGTPP